MCCIYNMVCESTVRSDMGPVQKEQKTGKRSHSRSCGGMLCTWVHKKYRKSNQDYEVTNTFAVTNQQIAFVSHRNLHTTHASLTPFKRDPLFSGMQALTICEGKCVYACMCACNVCVPMHVWPRHVSFFLQRQNQDHGRSTPTDPPCHITTLHWYLDGICCLAAACPSETAPLR